jgi:fatty acid desaturase
VFRVAENSKATTSTAKVQLRTAFKHLRVPVKGHKFAVKIMVCATIVVCGGALALQPLLWYRLSGILLLGLMFAHAAELQHEALHNLGFNRAWANTVAGTLLGIPLGISFAAYRAAHLRHHRYLGTPQNREFFDYGDQYGTDAREGRVAAARKWISRFLMIQHFRAVVKELVLCSIGRREFEGETGTTSRRIRRNYRLICLALIGFVALSVFLGEALVMWLWLLPLLVAAPVHAFVELPEHYRCETLVEDPFKNTRSIRSNRLMTWFTNGNNFHVEHHLMPNLPMSQLPALHVEIKDQLEYYHPTYRDFFRSLLATKDARRAAASTERS